MLEMHTTHLYKDNELMIVGGRALETGQNLSQIAFSDSIYTVNLETGKVAKLGLLPSALGSHVSALVDDKYLVVYGGTNGFRFFDSILRYEIEAK